MTRQNIRNDFYIFCALTHRNIKVLGGKVVSLIIDGLFAVAINVLVFGYFLPIMGMPATLISPMYLGTAIMTLFHLGFILSMQTVFDLKFNRFIDYHLTLPISKTWLFGTYIVNFALEALSVTIPLLTFGVILLGSRFKILELSPLGACTNYLLGILFFGLFFLWLAFNYPYNWFVDNVWPRRLGPLFSFSCIFYTYKSIASFNPTIAKLFLLNPTAHVAEGLRRGIIGGDNFLPPLITISALVLSVIVMILLLVRALNKKLDPV